MNKLLFEFAKLKAKIKKAKEFLKIYKLWCKNLDKVGDIKYKESIK